MATKTRRTLVKAFKVGLILTSALLLSSANAHYSLPPLPPELYAPIAPAATTTSFTVSWQSTSGYLCKLSEKVNDGIWATVSNTSSPINSVTLTRAIGDYDYQLTCIGLPGGGSVGPVTSVAVVATIPSLDPLDAQLGYQFTVRTGDIDSDGKKDIYLKRTSGGNANNGVIDKTILTQNIDGHFEVLQDPTSGQFSTAGGWPISASVTAVVNDFNVDGRVDVLLKNLDSVIGNVDDQIIFSSGKFFNGAAQAATSIDFEFEKFFRDTYNWILDPNYFSQALVAGLPAYNLAVTLKVWFCINYGYSTPCVNTSRHVYNKTITLAKMGLSGYQTTEAAEAALAASLGFASYDSFRCKLICGWLDFYRFYGSIAFNVEDVWTPTTESPAFDDITFSKPGSDLADIFGSIFNSGTFVPGSEGIIKVGEIIGDILGSVILDGVFGQGSTVYEDVDGISRNEIMIIPDLFATLVSSTNQSQTPSAFGTLIANPLPGSSINKKNHSGGNCTSDGRYDTTGVFRNGPKHFGVDLGSGSTNVSVGTPVLAAGDGNAVYANQPSKAGKLLEIYHKFGFVSRYLHLNTTITTSRQNGVKAGDQIATVGRSGNVLSCSKTHLHFSTKIVGKPFDPTPVFNWPLEQ